jgi:hypothetical protein
MNDNDLDSEKRNCKSQDLMTNLADEKLNQDKWLVDNHLAEPHADSEPGGTWKSVPSAACSANS